MEFHTENISNAYSFNNFFKFIYLFLRDRDRMRISGGGAERKWDRGSKAGAVLEADSLMQAQTHAP